MLKIPIRQKIFITTPLKVKFDESYSKYRDNKNAHFKSLQTNLQTNLE
jgi:hypothetical protein